MLIPTPGQHLAALTIAFAAGVLTAKLWRWHGCWMYELGRKDRDEDRE